MRSVQDSTARVISRDTGLMAIWNTWAVSTSSSRFEESGSSCRKWNRHWRSTPEYTKLQWSLARILAVGRTWWLMLLEIVAIGDPKWNGRGHIANVYPSGKKCGRLLISKARFLRIPPSTLPD